MKHTFQLETSRKKALREGVRDGLPIGLGYLAVSFSLGIAAKNAGLNAFQGFLASLLCNASAGEYAAFTTIATDAAYLELALVTLIANARYLLMSCSLSQKFAPGTPLYHRLLVGYDVTDEIFGITIARPGKLNPYYTYGAILVAAPCWACGTSLGIIAGNLLPLRVVSALSVALYGMFLAIIVPPAKKSRPVLFAVLGAMGISCLFTYVPVINQISSGFAIIIATVVAAGVAAFVCPIREEEGGEDHAV